MDLKADDALNVDIDPALLLSYELDKLNLDSIPNDIFDHLKLSDESPKTDDKIDVKTDFSLKDNKINESALFNCIEIKTEKTSVDEKKPCDTEVKTETVSEYLEIKKDINGNNESISEENLNELFVQLELSDSDNEEIDSIDHLKERGPLRSSKGRRAYRKKDANNLWLKSDSCDRAQFNSDRLKFWSGSSQIQFSESVVPTHYALNNNNQSIIYDGVETTHNLLTQDSYFEDARAVSSPESGYDSSCAHSIAGSPPPILFTSSANLDFIPETVDEQIILDFLAENTDCALIENNLAACNIDTKDAEGKITEIINFLKDIPSELTDSSNVTVSSHNHLSTAVPFPSHSTSTASNTSDLKLSPVSNISDLKLSPISNISDLKLSPVSNISDGKSSLISLNTVSKNLEPKKLVPKLKENAKGALRRFLSEEEYNDAIKRIYEKIRDDKKIKGDEGISVIYVEDEMDKDSKNRTNLHNAVLNGKIEDIFSIVEIHKQYDLPFADINIRDKHGKTALDYAVQNQMTLVADYLKENTACQSVNLEK